MIKIKEFPIIGRIIQRRYSSTIIITNYEKLPTGILMEINQIAFIINTISYYPDLICVISNENSDEFVDKLVRISSFCKIENGM